MGRLRFELRTNRLKAECSTAELATQEAFGCNHRIPALTGSRTPTGSKRRYHPEGRLRYGPTLLRRTRPLRWQLKAKQQEGRFLGSAGENGVR